MMAIIAASGITLVGLLGAPLLIAALIASTAATTAAATCEITELPAGAGQWRAPYHQAYALSARGFGMRQHPILGTYRMHNGQDMTSLPSAGPVLAASAGTVTRARYSSGLGNHVVIDHGDGITTTYGHLATITPGIAPGAAVWTGQQLGIEGSTGMSTGNHLHFEVHHDGTPVDPVPFMAQRGAPLNGVPAAPSAPPGEQIADPGARQGGIGFALPAASEPRLASLTNPPAPIPEHVKALYLAAADEYALPWTLLAGIGMAETAHGATTATSSAGAQGLMQFMPATWTQYGIDGNGDGHADIGNDADSIHSAANYLTASGVTAGPDGVRRALFAYNRADWYVNDVLHYAHHYGGGIVAGDPADCGPGGNGDPTIATLDAQQIETVLTFATSRIGDPYRYGAAGPNAWDCSSFTQAAYARVGLTLP
ncbi:MAG: peptidoglycan DD-metalloendopeptidase family protein, partial [Actinomycetales bacterium]|nr:peptidoglycan DD-metalloendopeptidase family protein [Actinomycetales bacterium]